MTIREANQQDVERLAVLFDAYRVFYDQPSNVAEAKLFLEERINRSESKIYLAEDSDQELAGFTQLYPLFSSVRMKRLWLLNDLFVDRRFRGSGISVLLLDKAKLLCKETRAAGLMLETSISNVIANQLYLKNGFRPEKESNFYTWQNLDRPDYK